MILFLRQFLSYRYRGISVSASKQALLLSQP